MADHLPPGIQLIRTFENPPRYVYGVDWSPDGRLAVFALGDGTVRAYDIESGNVHRWFTCIPPVTSVACSRQFKTSIICSSGKISIINLDSGESREINSVTDASLVAIVPDGRRALIGRSNGGIEVWDIEAATTLRSISGHASEVTSIAVIGDGLHAVSASHDGTIWVWDIESGEQLRKLDGHSSGLLRGSLARRSSLLRLRRPDNQGMGFVERCEIQTLEGHSQSVGVVAVSADGSALLSAAVDGKFRVWDTSSWRFVECQSAWRGFDWGWVSGVLRPGTRRRRITFSLMIYINMNLALCSGSGRAPPRGRSGMPTRRSSCWETAASGSRGSAWS